MGGIFLFKKMYQLGFGFLCGYLFIKWVPFAIRPSLEEVLVNFVLKPLEFFIAAVTLIVGIVLNGELIKYILIMIVNSIHQKNWSVLALVICLGVFINFFALFKIGIWQSWMLLCFSLLYGMISLIDKTA